MAASTTPPLLDLPGHILDLAQACRRAGGRLYVVGGSVRDALLQRSYHDHDLEVHGLDHADLRAVLASLGPTKEVGQGFRVFKVRMGKETVDVALPAEDSDSLDDAARRRDLTVNALAYDPLEDQLVDPVGGTADLRAGLLREVHPHTFAEDPLRVLRVGRFMGSLGLRPTPELTALCRSLSLEGLPQERMRIELERLLLESPAPSEAVAWLHEVGALAAIHPRLAQAGSHPEALDRAAGLRPHAGELPRKAALMWSIFLGPDPDGVAPLFEQLRVGRRLGYPLATTILRLVERGFTLPAPCTDEVLLRAAEELEVGLWTLAARAWTGTEAAREAWLRAHALGVAREALPPLLGGRQLLDQGVPHGRPVGELLEAVREAQLTGAISTPVEAHSLAMRLWSTRSGQSH